MKHYFTYYCVIFMGLMMAGTLDAAKRTPPVVASCPKPPAAKQTKVVLATAADVHATTVTPEIAALPTSDTAMAANPDLDDTEVIPDIDDDEMQEEPDAAASQAVTIAKAAEYFDIDAKRAATIKLVQQGIDFLTKNSDDKAFNALSHDKRFVQGDLSLFVFDCTKDKQGICVANGQETQLLWQNLYDLKDTYGTYVVQAIIATARQGGGWVTYQWRNATKVSYVKLVTKGDKTYVIGSGYYPNSKVDAVVNLVKGAVALFNQTMASNGSKDEAFSTFSYPLGRFVYGDLYLYALDFKGLQVAHGDLPGLIGTNSWDYRDANGKLVNQEVIARLKDTQLGEGVWYEYVSKNANKRAYAEKIKDREGNYYFVACGYYPGADREQAVSLVKKGYTYMKGVGRTQAAHAFSDKHSKDFIFGDLYLIVYDLKGMCVANGGNPENVNTNYFDARDEDGEYYVRSLIKKAQDGGGWIDCKLKNSFRSIYVEKIDLGIESFAICVGLYPISKYETMVLVAKSGIGYMKTNTLEQALSECVKPGGKFIRGDLSLFVFDTAGICLAYGDDYDLIWRNLLNINDDDGRPFVKLFINNTKHGPGTISYKLNGVMKTAYVEQTEKNGRTYIVGSSFYR